LRLISRQRQKLVGLAASAKNRLHKVRTFGAGRFCRDTGRLLTH
jgi:hypothetical protein